MKKITSLFYGTLLLLLWTACQAEKKEIDYTTGLKIGYLPSTDVLPYIVAQQTGLYDSLQLDLKLMPMESETERDTLFQQKKSDGSILSPMEAFAQQAQGFSLHPTLTNQGTYYIVGSNDSTFTKPEQLIGKCLSVARGAASAFFADEVLEKLEIAPDDVHRPELSTEQLRMQMLENGQIDAAVLREPAVSLLLQQGCRILATSSAYPVALSVTAFSDSILSSKSEEIKKLITGYNLAVEYMNKHPQKEWLPQAALAAGLQGITQELPPYKSTSPLSAADTQKIVQWMQQHTLLPSSFSLRPHGHPAVNALYK